MVGLIGLLLLDLSIGLNDSRVLRKEPRVVPEVNTPTPKIGSGYPILEREIRTSNNKNRVGDESVWEVGP